MKDFIEMYNVFLATDSLVLEAVKKDVSAILRKSEKIYSNLLNQIDYLNGEIKLLSKKNNLFPKKSLTKLLMDKTLQLNSLKKMKKDQFINKEYLIDLLDAVDNALDYHSNPGNAARGIEVIMFCNNYHLQD